jgi:hypothetical protein
VWKLAKDGAIFTDTMQRSHIVVCALCALLFVKPVFADDVQKAAPVEGGLFFNTTLKLGGWDDSRITYWFAFTPWFSARLGDKAAIYLSANIQEKCRDFIWKYRASPQEFAPEPQRFEIAWSPVNFVNLEAGRIFVEDPLGLVARDFFDGVRGVLAFRNGQISLAGLYSGLRYKGNTLIFMTPGDLALSEREKRYTASRRALASLNADYFFNPWSGLALNALAQFDLNYGSTRLDSQYLIMKYHANPVSPLFIHAGGVAGLVETHGGSRDPALNFAASLGANLLTPGPLHDMLRFYALWTSGASNGKVGPFLPLTTIWQGEVFERKQSGLASFTAGYRVLPFTHFAFNMDFSYYLRTDRETVSYPGLREGADGYALGGEVYGGTGWLLRGQKFDAAVSAGGGAFLPQLGNVWERGAKTEWYFTVSVRIAARSRAADRQSMGKAKDEARELLGFDRPFGEEEIKAPLIGAASCAMGGMGDMTPAAAPSTPGGDCLNETGSGWNSPNRTGHASDGNAAAGIAWYFRD